jgi:hypothetical protein
VITNLDTKQNMTKKWKYLSPILHTTFNVRFWHTHSYDSVNVCDNGWSITQSQCWTLPFVGSIFHIHDVLEVDCTPVLKCLVVILMTLHNQWQRSGCNPAPSKCYDSTLVTRSPLPLSLTIQNTVGMTNNYLKWGRTNPEMVCISSIPYKMDHVKHSKSSKHQNKSKSVFASWDIQHMHIEILSRYNCAGSYEPHTFPDVGKTCRT